MDTCPFPRACWKPAEPSDRGFLSTWQLGTWWCYVRSILSQLYVFCHPLLQEGGMPAPSCLCCSSRSSSWLPSSPLLVWSAGGWWSLGWWEWLGAASVTCSWTARSCTVQVRKRGLNVPDTRQAHRSQLGRLRTLAEVRTNPQLVWNALLEEPGEDVLRGLCGELDPEYCTTPLMQIGKNPSEGGSFCWDAVCKQN